MVTIVILTELRLVQRQNIFCNKANKMFMILYYVLTLLNIYKILIEQWNDITIDVYKEWKLGWTEVDGGKRFKNALYDQTIGKSIIKLNKMSYLSYYLITSNIIYCMHVKYICLHKYNYINTDTYMCIYTNYILCI